MKGVHKIPVPVHEASNFAFHFRDPETKASRRYIGGGPIFIAPGLSRLVGQLGKPGAGICVAENGLDRSGVARTGLADAYVGGRRHRLRLAGRRRSATAESSLWLIANKRTPRVPLIHKSPGGCSAPFQSGDRLAVRFMDGSLRREGGARYQVLPLKGEDLWGHGVLYPRSFRNKPQPDQRLVKNLIAPIRRAETARIINLT